MQMCIDSGSADTITVAHICFRFQIDFAEKESNETEKKIQLQLTVNAVDYYDYCV